MKRISHRTTDSELGVQILPGPPILNLYKTLSIVFINFSDEGSVIEEKCFSNIFEVYIKCSLTECERRDNKDLYKKARRGIIKNFTGVDGPYDPPTHPDILVETEKYSAEKSVSHILERLKGLKIIKG